MKIVNAKQNDAISNMRMNKEYGFDNMIAANSEVHKHQNILLFLYLSLYCSNDIFTALDLCHGLLPCERKTNDAQYGE